MADPRFTLTGLAPAGLLVDLETSGFSPPFAADPVAVGLVVDRGGHALVPLGPVPAVPPLRRKLAELLAAALNGLAAEARAIRDPLDPAHLDAVSEQSRALAERLHRNRSDAAE